MIYKMKLLIFIKIWQHSQYSYSYYYIKQKKSLDYSYLTNLNFNVIFIIILLKVNKTKDYFSITDMIYRFTNFYYFYNKLNLANITEKAIKFSEIFLS